MTHHTSTGARHEGDEFDCPFCRETLLEAFRAPVTAPEQPGERCTPGERCRPPEAPCTEHWHHPRPEPETLAGECPYCDDNPYADIAAHVLARHPDEYAEWEAMLRHPSAQPPVPAGHTVDTQVTPYDDAPGGIWWVTCSCGWSRSGQYRSDGMGHRVAVRLVESWRKEHLRNPIKDGDNGQ